MLFVSEKIGERFSLIVFDASDTSEKVVFETCERFLVAAALPSVVVRKVPEPRVSRKDGVRVVVGEHSSVAPEVEFDLQGEFRERLRIPLSGHEDVQVVESRKRFEKYFAFFEFFAQRKRAFTVQLHFDTSGIPFVVFSTVYTDGNVIPFSYAPGKGGVPSGFGFPGAEKDEI